VLADYQANYRRYVEKPLGDKAVAAITAADVRAFRLARHPFLLGDLRHRQSITDHRHHRLIPLLNHAQLRHGNERQGSTEAAAKNQPKHPASTETETSTVSRRHTNGVCAVRVSNPGPAD
jgi:hypothetical protein